VVKDATITAPAATSGTDLTAPLRGVACRGLVTPARAKRLAVNGKTFPLEQPAAVMKRFAGMTSNQ
jgi:hypothetical protein